jgi:uncharacterized YccA/Bax inhibitor family protein
MLKRFSEWVTPSFEAGSIHTTSSGWNDSTAATETSTGTMTIQGAINKTLILFGLLLVTAFISYQAPNPVLIIGGAIAGLIIVIISVFKREYSHILAPIYALLEGFVVGGVSAMYAGFGGGIVIQAISLTLLVLFIMLLIHKTGIIPVTQQFRMGVVMATGAIALLYLISFVLSFFGIHIPYIHQGGPSALYFSGCHRCLLNLLLDFDNIVKGRIQGTQVYGMVLCHGPDDHVDLALL